jgi:hypothetical protein
MAFIELQGATAARAGELGAVVPGHVRGFAQASSWSIETPERRMLLLPQTGIKPVTDPPRVE